MTTRRDRGLVVGDMGLPGLHITPLEEDSDEETPFSIGHVGHEEKKRIPPYLPVCLHLKCKAKIHVKVVHGDIAQSGVDCIVSAAAEGLLAASGCAGVLSRAGGENLATDVTNYIQEHGHLQSGDVAVTDGGKIECSRIIHACGGSSEAVLVKMFDKCLEKAMDTESIAIPGVGGGQRGVATAIVAGALCQSVTEFCKAAVTTPCDLKHILLVDLNESMVQGFVDALQKEVTKGTFELTDFDEDVSASRRGCGLDRGRFNESHNDEDLPGYEGCGTITIVYDIPSGIQSAKENHPNPGKQYTGIKRTAYLPNNEQGKNLMDLMEQAFRDGHTFDIGTSQATGSSGVIIWSGKVSHRTNTTGGPAKYGYPDNGYLDKVEAELAALGFQ